jgi:uncharacterized protein (TIGR02246 family)
MAGRDNVSTRGAGPSTSEEAEEIRRLAHRLFEAWNRGDGSAYASHFTEDSDYIAFDGTHLKGRQANAEHHQKLFDTWLKGSVLEGRVKDIRLVRPDVAVVHLGGGVRLRWQSKVAPGRQSIQTLVAVKDGGEWKFTAFQNTRLQRMTPLHMLMMIFGRR